MKIIKKVKKEIEEETEYCDICGEKMGYGSCDIDLEYLDEENYNYGSDGRYEKSYHYDICEECVEKVLFPYIKKKTKKDPRTEEIDY